MGTKRLWAALAALTVLAVAAWWSRGERAGQPMPRDGSVPGRTRPAVAWSKAKPQRVPAGLSGEVSDDRGAAVPRARVCATCASCDPTLVATPHCADSDALGRYRLSELEPLGYLVTAAASGFAPAQANHGVPLFVGPGEAKSGVDITLTKRGVELTGTVLDALGGPIAQARVRASQGEGAATALEVHSDDEGHFRVWATPGKITLIASAPGYAPARQFRVAPSRDVELILTPASSLQGAVLSRADGSPIADAQVRAYRLNNLPLPTDGPARSQKDGSFSIENLEPGEYVVEAIGPNYRGLSAGTVSIGLGDRVGGVVVPVDRAATVSGRVLIGAQGAPCQKGLVMLGAPGPSAFAAPASVAAIMRSMADAPQSEQASVASLMASIGAEGGVRFEGVPAGRYMVTVRCTDHILRRGPELLAVGVQPVADLEWRVERGLSLTVVVVDEDKRPLPRAQAALMFPAFEPGRPVPMMPITTGADGRYLMPSELYPGTYRVEPYAGASGEPVEVTLQEGQKASEVVLTLHGSATLLVQVQTLDSQPIDNVDVFARVGDGTPEAEQGAAPRKAWNATPVGAGEYRFAPMPAGTYRVEVDDGINPVSHARQGASHGITVAPRGVTRASVVLPRAAEIRGRVVDERGQPLSNIWVSAEREGGDDDGGALRSLTRMLERPRKLSDSEGRFVLDHLSAGASFLVRAEQPGGGAQVVRGVRAGSDVDVVLRSPASVRGVVTDAQGAPSEAFTLQAVQLETGEQRSAQVSGPGGRFALDGVTPGSVELTASDTKLRVGRLRIEVAPGQTYSGLRLTLKEPQVAELPSQAAP